MEPLVSTEWLAGELGKPDLVVFDATKYLPNEGRDGAAEFLLDLRPSKKRAGDSSGPITERAVVDPRWRWRDLLEHWCGLSGLWRSCAGCGDEGGGGVGFPKL